MQRIRRRTALGLVAGGAGLAAYAASGLSFAAPLAAAAGVPTNTVFIKSALAFDPVGETVTLPLFRGLTPSGGDAWYIVTESSNAADAAARGVNLAQKLVNALGTMAVQRAPLVNGIRQFSGTVDFSGQYVVVPSSPNGFPPTQADPGAIGDANYSPYITAGDGIVLNASQVANNTGQHAALAGIDFTGRTVTLKLFEGFYDHHPILYLRMDASIRLVAAIESSNYAPNMNAAPGEGSPDFATSARQAIIPVVNGPRGINNPMRQGLESALLGEGPPRNVTQAKPTDVLYTPVWDVTPVKWTAAAVAAGQVKQLTKDTEVAAEFTMGRVFSFGSGPANASLSGIQALGAVSNCPIVAELD